MLPDCDKSGARPMMLWPFGIKLEAISEARVNYCYERPEYRDREFFSAMCCG
jgi:hypothetical protein